ncbi:hypothetical protein [Actinoplanes sp. G11-F43]|uniref:hypothetical protein n=1 Tax=Actinoplanes sp. G11-F43 TaxID=3424130 RepID=UPI003D342DA4
MKRTENRNVIIPGGSSLMPSHSQGTERRPERRAGRTLPRAFAVPATDETIPAAYGLIATADENIRAPKGKIRPRSHVHRHSPAARPVPEDVRA